MAELQINTTQNVNINFTAASVGERILAYIIDLIIKIAYAVVVFQLILKGLGVMDALENMDNWSQAAVVIIFFSPAIFYSLIFESIMEGQTIGKRIMKIKVVKIDGYQASFADFFVRWIFRIVDINMMSGGLAVIAIILTSKNQRLGDVTAGTAVISLKNKISINHTILEDLDVDYVPTYPSVIKLSDNDARIIKETFNKAKQSKDYDMLSKLRNKIIEVTNIKDVQGNDIQFIDTVLKDYNYYTQNM